MEDIEQLHEDVISGQIADIQIEPSSVDSNNYTDSENTIESEDAKEESTFYTDAKKYWSSVPATVDGMLGGFGGINYRDIKGSNEFLKNLFKMKPPLGRRTAVDCGAGIGRVSKHLLMPLFQTVDLVEQDENFANSAREFLGKESAQIGTIYNVGLQNFNPPPGKYNLIWCQWVLAHLTDEDLREFFIRASEALAKNGVIVLKENVTSTAVTTVDENDSSVTRSLQKFREIISLANLRVILSHKQTDFPKGLFPVYMLALRPVKKKQ